LRIERVAKLGAELDGLVEVLHPDETATCMIVGGDIFVMLLTHAKFKTFAPNEICDARKSTEVLVCLSCDSRENVDEMVRKAVAAGGNTYNQPQERGFMYGHGFQDLDGHLGNHLDRPRHDQSRLKRRFDMARYVDGFVLPVPKKNVQAYRRVAQLAGKVWREQWRARVHRVRCRRREAG